MTKKLYDLGRSYYDNDKMLFCQDVGVINSDSSMGCLFATFYGEKKKAAKESAIALLMILNPVNHG